VVLVLVSSEKMEVCLALPVEPRSFVSDIPTKPQLLLEGVWRALVAMSIGECAWQRVR